MSTFGWVATKQGHSFMVSKMVYHFICNIDLINKVHYITAAMHVLSYTTFFSPYDVHSFILTSWSLLCEAECCALSLIVQFSTRILLSRYRKANKTKIDSTQIWIKIIFRKSCQLNLHPLTQKSSSLPIQDTEVKFDQNTQCVFSYSTKGSLFSPVSLV